jgi:hypothetical protein
LRSGGPPPVNHTRVDGKPIVSHCRTPALPEAISAWLHELTVFAFDLLLGWVDLRHELSMLKDLLTRLVRGGSRSA